MTLSPPQSAIPGQVYALSLLFYDSQSGILVDPSQLQLDVTYGSEAPLVPDVTGGGPFFYTGTADTGRPQPGMLCRISAGSYIFYWIPVPTLAGGVYTANWTATYGPDNDLFGPICEDFPLAAGFAPNVTSADTGFWTGSLSYQPPYLSSPLVIPFGSVDASGVAWMLKQVTGWDSPPAGSGAVIQRTADHGGYPAAQYYGPRLITLTVLASAPSQALRDQARALMQQAVPVSDLAAFTYGEPVPKVAYVRRNAQAGVTETYPTLADVEFTVPLVAPDPRKYATPAQSASVIVPPPVSNPLALPFASGLPVTFPPASPPSSTALSVTNSGTFETRPVITITGPAGQPAAVNGTTGQQISFGNLTLGSTDTLVLYTDARQAFLNGAFTPADPWSSWWVLYPGTSQVYLGGSPSGGAGIQVSWSSAWI